MQVGLLARRWPHVATIVAARFAAPAGAPPQVGPRLVVIGCALQGDGGGVAQRWTSGRPAEARISCTDVLRASGSDRPASRRRRLLLEACRPEQVAGDDRCSWQATPRDLRQRAMRQASRACDLLWRQAAEDGARAVVHAAAYAPLPAANEQLASRGRSRILRPGRRCRHDRNSRTRSARRRLRPHAAHSGG